MLLNTWSLVFISIQIISITFHIWCYCIHFSHPKTLIALKITAFLWHVPLSLIPIVTLHGCQYLNRSQSDLVQADIKNNTQFGFDLHNC